MCFSRASHALVPINFHILNITIQGKPAGVLNRPTGSRSMISKNLQQGSSINASKPIRVLNRLAGSGTMLAWYQYKLIGELNRPAGSREILGKRDMVNAPLCT